MIVQNATLPLPAPATRRTASPERRRVSSLTLFRKWSWIVLIGASLLQVSFFPSNECVVAVACSLVSWGLFTMYFLQPGILTRYPLSTLLVLGFTTTQLYFPIVFTLLEGNPVTYNLVLSNEVFFHNTGAFLALLLGHRLYRLWTTPLVQLRSWFRSMGLFKVPTDGQVWLMGIIGLGVMSVSTFFSETQGIKTPDTVTGKILWAMSGFSYAPFILTIGKMYGGKQSLDRKKIVLLVVFTILIFVAGIVRNSRSTFVYGFAALGFALALSYLLELYSFRILTYKNLIAGLLVGWLMTGPIADLGVAMTLVRANRADVSSLELLSMTIDAYGDKSTIDKVQSIALNDYLDWDERYVENVFLARFCNLKFADSNLLLAQKLGGIDGQTVDRMVDGIFAALPEPAIEFLGIDMNKKAVRSGSLTDFLFYRTSGDSNKIGSFLYGHFSGIGMVTLGYWYLVVLCLTIVPVFCFFDAFVLVGVAQAVQRGLSTSRLVHQFSFCILLQLTTIFMFLTTDTVTTTINFLLRNSFEIIALYLIVFQLTRFITRLSSW